MVYRSVLVKLPFHSTGCRAESCGREMKGTRTERRVRSGSTSVRARIGHRLAQQSSSCRVSPLLGSGRTVSSRCDFLQRARLVKTSRRGLGSHLVPHTAMRAMHIQRPPLSRKTASSSGDRQVALAMFARPSHGDSQRVQARDKQSARHWTRRERPNAHWHVAAEERRDDNR